MTDTHYELWYGADGVSITEYDLDTAPEPTVEEEWWFTWEEVFAELTGVSGYGPEIHSQ